VGGVDTGILTFINHGCRGTNNFGQQFPFHEMNILEECRNDDGDDDDDEKGTSTSEKPPCSSTCSDHQNIVYDPFFERQYSILSCMESIIAERDIAVGEEILDNYLCMGGADYLMENIRNLQEMCSGGIGDVTKYETSTATMSD
jgi:hypothetical protein